MVDTDKKNAGLSAMVRELAEQVDKLESDLIDAPYISGVDWSVCEHIEDALQSCISARMNVLQVIQEQEDDHGNS